MSNVLRAPSTAWPTVGLALTCVAATAGALTGAVTAQVPTVVAAVIVFAAAFAAFTPMHDASHRSVSRNEWLNEVVGRASSMVLLAPYVAFRYVHLQHHKHTNDAEHDPDFYAGRGSKWLLPLRWLTQDFHYYWVIATRWRQRPTAERVEVVINVATIVALVAGFIASGHGLTLLLAWLVPVRLAIACLALSFDYLPHVPYAARASEDRFAATRILIAPGLTGLFLFQNYHLIHHLYPGVPFYRYRKVFEARRDKLLAQGARVWRWGGPDAHGSSVSTVEPEGAMKPSTASR